MGFGDLLLMRFDPGAVGFDRLSGGGGFGFPGVVIGARDLALFDETLVAGAVALGAVREGLVLG